MNQRTSSPYLFTAPGKLPQASCPVCGQASIIDRDQVVPTCFAEAMAGIQKPHDRVRCPHQDERWHLQAQRLRHESHSTASPRLRALIERDLDELLEQHRGP